MKKEITLKLISERYEINAQTNPGAPVEPERLELVTDAVFSEKNGRIEIKYSESELSGLGDTETLLIFERDQTDALTMIRRGTVEVTMVFSTGLRHLCVYKTQILPIEIVVTTKSLKNRLTEDGSLELDYTSELSGVSLARTMIRIEIKDKVK